MDNAQLYLSTVIPTVTVILAWLSNKSNMADSLRSERKALGRAIHSDMIPSTNDSP